MEIDHLTADFTFLKSYNTAQIQADDFIIDTLKEKFSVKNDAAKFSKNKYRANPRKSIITNTGRFDIGMFPAIYKYLKSMGVVCSMDDIFRERVKPTIADVVQLDDNMCFKMRYYQYDSIVKGLRVGYGIFELGTGAGKSLLTASLCENTLLHKKNWKILIIVPGTSLHIQLGKDFEEYGVKFDYSRWGADYALEDTNVVIVNSEYLTRNAKDNPWIRNVDMLIVDEAHKIHGDSSISKVVKSVRTPNKFAMTGTLPDDLFKKWRVIGAFGNVLYKKPVSELKDEGFLSSSTIKMIKLVHQNPPNIPASKDGTAYRAEVEWISSSACRNSPIVEKCKTLQNNSLILVDRLDHGETFIKLFEGSDKDVVFIHGGVPTEERTDLLERMEKNNNVVAIAMSAIFSTGINVKNIHNVIFTYGGKSFIRVVQSIGRGLRLHESKELLTIYDYYDNLRYSEAHSEKRRLFYEMEGHDVKKAKISVIPT